MPYAQISAKLGIPVGSIGPTCADNRALSRRSALVTTYGRRSRAALQIGHYERVLPMLGEPARCLTMPCGA